MFENHALSALLRSLDHLRQGSLELVTPDGRVRRFEGREPGSVARLELHDWSVPRRMLLEGDCAFARDYCTGRWDTPDLGALVALGLENEAILQPYLHGGAVARLLGRVCTLLRVNSLRGSRRNVRAHYDLGNDFYALWLDSTMTYSSALYGADVDASLETAQLRKYDRLLERLELERGSVLEVGCGWGGFAERAVSRGDYALTGVTLSDAQYQYARRRLGASADIRLCDYREVQRRHDGIVSIEMFEAVGEAYWRTWFDKVRALLRPGAKAAVQTITIDDARFERYRRGGDAIRRYIFPGGMLPSPRRFREVAREAGLSCHDEFHFGGDYARTLDAWLHNFDRRATEVRALGYDERFIRLWRFYLAACGAGFRSGRTSVMHVTLVAA